MAGVNDCVVNAVRPRSAGVVWALAHAAPPNNTTANRQGRVMNRFSSPETALCGTPIVAGNSPVTRLLRSVVGRSLLWHGLPTVPPAPDRRSPLLERFNPKQTFGRKTWPGRETRPQQRKSRDTFVTIPRPRLLVYKVSEP